MSTSMFARFASCSSSASQSLGRGWDIERKSFTVFSHRPKWLHTAGMWLVANSATWRTRPCASAREGAAYEHWSASLGQQWEKGGARSCEVVRGSCEVVPVTRGGATLIAAR